MSHDLSPANDLPPTDLSTVNVGERLQKVLAKAGVGSRRACEELIRLGRVSVNDKVVTALGTRVRPDDIVALDGRRIGKASGPIYLALHKPPGYVSTANDPWGRPTVLSLVSAMPRVFAVGRLDYDSEGLLLLTNDGNLAYRLTHPRFYVDKEYEVIVDGVVEPEILRRLREGIELDGRKTVPATVELLGQSRGANARLRFVIHEGRKRQVRRMCEAVGLIVRRLVRTRVGPIRLGTLPAGVSRPLSAVEVKQLRDAVEKDEDPPAGLQVIAIDGPAGSGKSSLAGELAKRHQILFLDTGTLYRAVTLLALDRAVDPHDEQAVAKLAREADIEVLPPTKPDGRAYTVCVDAQDVTWELFTPPVDASVSVISAIPAVRQALLTRQRQIALRGKAVLVGRDIGTVVVPEASIKIYLDASPEVRARRRATQLKARGIDVPYDQVLGEIRKRDQLDSGRATAPLLPAKDAIVLNSDSLALDDELARVEDLMAKRWGC